MVLEGKFSIGDLAYLVLEWDQGQNEWEIMTLCVQEDTQTSFVANLIFHSVQSHGLEP